MTLPTAPPFRGADEDWDKIPPSALSMAGMSFIIGYLSEDTTGKNITKAWVQEYLRNGIDVVFVYEFDPDQPLQGYGRGATDALKMCNWATEIGAPEGVALYVALDRDFPTSTYPQIDSYVASWSHVCHNWGYRSGAYGKFDLIRGILDHELADFGWQTYAWSQSQWDPRVAIRQTVNGTHVAGHQVDLDTATVLDFGQWRATGTSILTGGFMSLTDDLIQGWATGALKLSDGSDNLLTVRQQRADKFMADTRTALDTTIAQVQTNGSALSSIASDVAAIKQTLLTLGSGDGATGPESELLDRLDRIAAACEGLVAIAKEFPTGETPPPAASSASETPVQPDSQP